MCESDLFPHQKLLVIIVHLMNGKWCLVSLLSFSWLLWGCVYFHSFVFPLSGCPFLWIAYSYTLTGFLLSCLLINWVVGGICILGVCILLCHICCKLYLLNHLSFDYVFCYFYVVNRATFPLSLLGFLCCLEKIFLRPRIFLSVFKTLMYLKFAFILHELGDKLWSPRGTAKSAGSIYGIKYLFLPHWIKVTLLPHYVSSNNLISFWTWSLKWSICLFFCVC